MFNLKNKTIIITGGAGLIGSAFSRACAENGANVVVADIDKKRGDNLVKKIKKETGNKNLIFWKCDITKTGDIKNLIAETLKKFKKIDALVNNAYPRNKNFGRKWLDVSYEDFCENVNMHLGGYFLITQQVVKIMIKQNYGNIINMASVYGFLAPRFKIYEETNVTPATAEYSAVKGAIINLTRYWASALGEYNIRVNAISPGGVLDKQSKKFIEKYSERVILGKRMAKKEDLTGALIFLLSDASDYITGQNIIIDGGFTL